MHNILRTDKLKDLAWLHTHVGSEYRVGCSGWSYDAWVGPFYPARTKPGEYLSQYSSVFDTVEIDSTFYRVPSAEMVRSWYRSTPDGFLFCPKVPKQITHELKLREADVLFASFIDVVKLLRNKLGPVLVQLPPSFTFDRDVKRLTNFLDHVPDDIELAVEFRHNSWFNELTTKLLQEHRVTMAWSVFPGVSNPGLVTSKTGYLRLVGDRSIREEDFGRIQRDRTDETNGWSKRIKELQGDLEHVFAFANNHYQGFGPASVNLLREGLGMNAIDWKRRMHKNLDKSQRTLF